MAQRAQRQVGAYIGHKAHHLAALGRCCVQIEIWQQYGLDGVQDTTIGRRLDLVTQSGHVAVVSSGRVGADSEVFQTRAFDVRLDALGLGAMPRVHLVAEQLDATRQDSVAVARHVNELVPQFVGLSQPFDRYRRRRRWSSTEVAKYQVD